MSWCRVGGQEDEALAGSCRGALDRLGVVPSRRWLSARGALYYATSFGVHGDGAGL